MVSTPSGTQAPFIFEATVFNIFPCNRKGEQRLKCEGCGAVRKECVLPCVGEEQGRECIKLEG